MWWFRRVGIDEGLVLLLGAYEGVCVAVVVRKAWMSGFEI